MDDLEEWQKRVNYEMVTLEEKLERLMLFINSSKFKEISDYQQKLLEEQFNIMYDYYFILKRRLENNDVNIK